ncbi:hypothetical protein [uncultured Desulfobacter sp.]|uniref:hypothetical protein n=1 Tax=uncultured Desulfobacter sp. TaxID=240139 RepID=UPI002AAB87F2|nr:hypothetical protein [uncultured Desulfobacter sp.]
MKHFAHFFCFVLLFVFIGCAAPTMNLSVPVTETIAPNIDKAIVYFLRPKSLGFKIHAAVYDDETFIGFVPYGQKLPYVAEPGEHLFMVVSEAADFLKAELLAGKTYYVEVVPRMGAWRARFSLSPYTKEQLETQTVQKFIKEGRLIQNNEKAYEWDNSNHGSVLEKKMAYYPKWLSKDESARPFLNKEDCE